MAKINVTEVKGFEQLNNKLKQLDDKVKRREVLKIQRRLAKPIIQQYSQELPKGKKDKKRFGTTYVKETLSKSVKAVTVPSSKTGGNPSIVIRPAKKGKYDPWYRFMVVKKGTKTGGIGEGSRQGKNTVVDKARNKAFNNTKDSAIRDNEKKVAEYIQKQINRLSNK